jgi:uncharacterized protein (TIGR00645 family)
MEEKRHNKIEHGFEKFIFFSRWIQAPLYAGLIIGTIIYTLKFIIELWHLIQHGMSWSESDMMIGLLTLVDMTMVANLVIMVIIGGYYTFVSKIEIKGEDKLGWLDAVNAGILKVKLASSLVGVSGIHLLRTFITLESFKDNNVINYQIIIHLVFLISTLGLVLVEKWTPHEHSR